MHCAFVLDKDILRAGVASGLDAIESATRYAARLREGSPTGCDLDEIGACLYRLCQSATTVGLEEICRPAREVETALERLQAAHRDLTPDELCLLEEALDLLAALLLSVNVRTGFYSVSDDRSCLDRLRKTCA